MGRESEMREHGAGFPWPLVMVRAPSNDLWSLQKTLINLSVVTSATKFSHVCMKYAYKTHVFDWANLKEIAGPQK